MPSVPGEFTLLPAPGLSSRQETRLAVSRSNILLFGGHQIDGRSLYGDGALYHAADGAWAHVEAWPYESPPYFPGVVGIGDGNFVVLGLPCANPGEREEDAACNERLVGAMLDSTAGTWTELPAPSGGRFDRRLTEAAMWGVGMLGTRAVFDGGQDERLVTYDLQAKKWSQIDYPDPYVESGANRTRCQVGDSVVLALADEADHSVLTWTLGPTASEWTAPVARELPDYGSGTTGYGVGCAGNELLLFTGGPGGPSAIDTLDYYDVDTDAWSPLPPPPMPQFDTASTSVVVQGVRLMWPSHKGASVYTLSPGARAWSTKPPPFAGHTRLYSFANAILAFDDNYEGGLKLAIYGVAGH